jgi:hypothetical protein
LQVFKKAGKGGKMMFDKNVFKNKFRVWSSKNPLAKIEEVVFFCQNMIPTELHENYMWLQEESVAWFEWRQQNFQREFLKTQAEFLLEN